MWWDVSSETETPQYPLVLYKQWLISSPALLWRLLSLQCPHWIPELEFSSVLYFLAKGWIWGLDLPGHSAPLYTTKIWVWGGSGGGENLDWPVTCDTLEVGWQEFCACSRPGRGPNLRDLYTFGDSGRGVRPRARVTCAYEKLSVFPFWFLRNNRDKNKGRKMAKIIERIQVHLWWAKVQFGARQCRG